MTPNRKNIGLLALGVALSSIFPIAAAAMSRLLPMWAEKNAMHPPAIADVSYRRVRPPGSCPRPTGRHEVATGAFRSRGVTPGGETVVTIMVDGGAPLELSVSRPVYDAAGKLALGARVSLVSTVGNVMSGAQTPYRCIELAP